MTNPSVVIVAEIVRLAVHVGLSSGVELSGAIGAIALDDGVKPDHDSRGTR
jgi:hypothetical protein